MEATIAQMHEMLSKQMASEKEDIDARDTQLAASITQGIQAGMAQVASAMLVPKRIVKGKNNEIIGVEPVNTTIQ